MSPVRWRPILSGAPAAQALDAVGEIAAELAAADSHSNAWSSGTSLGTGKPGIALFFTVLHETTGDAAAADIARRLVEAAADEVSGATRLDHRLYGSTIGLGWVLTCLSGRLFDAEEDADEDSAVDEFVERLLSFDPWPAHYDLVTGLAGLGVYCLARLPRPRAARCLELVVARLSGMAEPVAGGAAWLTTPSMVPTRAEEFPDGHYDAGFAHGAAGVVAMLASAVHAGIDAAPLLEAATRWLLARRLGPAENSRYPARFAAAEPPASSRMAWCYGDPGVAVALLAAGRTLGSDEIVGEARTTARGCAGQVATARILDAGLCHGAAGAGHVLNRVGQALGDAEILDLARFWFGRLLDDRRPGSSVAGFPLLDPVASAVAGEDTYVAAPGLLEGAAGVGLALLSAIAEEPPWWDGVYVVGADGPFVARGT